MSKRVPGPNDWPDLLATARDAAVGLDGDAVPHGRLATTVSDECDIDTGTANDWIENAVGKDWLDRRGTGAGRTYVATDETVSLYDDTVLDGFLGDDDTPASEVERALDLTAEYYHSELNSDVRWLIEGKWGISNDTIDDLRIGFAPKDNRLPEYLAEHDISAEAALRAGVVRCSEVKAVYESDPDSARVDLPSALAEVATARAAGEVAPSDICLSAVLDAVRDIHEPRLYAWWDARVVFPYRDEDDTTRYFIARRTGPTDDVPGKYLKLAATKPWVDGDVVYEPIYGCGTVSPDQDLILTEGITDAIRAHEAGFACISPVTKAFKKDHYDELLSYSKQAQTSYLCFDSEESGIGLNGAIRTAWFLQENGVAARVAELPRGEREEKVDLAEYLKANSGDDLRGVLDDARHPATHPAFRPDLHTDVTWGAILDAVDGDSDTVRHDALVTHLRDEFAGTTEDAANQWAEAAVADDELERLDTASPVTYRLPDRGGATASGGSSSKSDEERTHSALFDLSIREAFEGTQAGWSLGTRGKHPVSHWGDSQNYFVYEEYKGDVRLRDFKADYTYTALTWLLVDAGERSAQSPAGPLSDAEIWEAWRHAKQEGVLDETDPIPWRARLHIARLHDLAPRDLIASAQDDPMQLPRTIHNRILDTVEEEYGVNPGKDRLDTDEKAERRAEFLAGDDSDDSDDKSRAIKRMLATLDELDN